MAFNPKGALKTLTQADVSKKDIQKLGKKAIDAATALPFFINAAHKFPDGKEGPLFLFGKLAKVKAEIKTLKGPEHLHGVAFVSTDDKGKTTLNLLPSKGKLESKTAILKKAMKDAFTPAFAEFKVGAPITEEAAEKLAEAAEKMEDIADEAEVGSADATEAPAEAASNETEAPAEAAASETEAPAEASGDKKDAKSVIMMIKEMSGLLKTSVAPIVANIKAKTTAATDAATIETTISKLEALKTSFAALSDEDKTGLAKNYEQVVAQAPALEKIKAALAGGGSPDSASSDDLDKFLKEMEASVKKTSGALDKALDNVKKTPATPIAGGKELLKTL